MRVAQIRTARLLIIRFLPPNLVSVMGQRATPSLVLSLKRPMVAATVHSSGIVLWRWFPLDKRGKSARMFSL